MYVLLSLSNKAQVNLVPNPSFESYTNCSVSMGVPNFTSINYTVKDWYCFYQMSPDYFNGCSNFDIGNPYPQYSTVPLHKYGNQIPRTGNAYVGIVIYDKTNSMDTLHMYHEDITIQLKDSLKTNTCYYGEFYANLSEVSGLCSNQFGMFITSTTFTTTAYTFTNTIQPQIQWDTTKYFTDSLNWIKISGYFMAQGGEKLVTIGNFKDGVVTRKIKSNSNFVCPPFIPDVQDVSYINIDDVSLYELPNHTGTQSYTLCAGDSLLLGDTVNLPMRYQWSLNGVVVDTTKNITVASSGTSSATSTSSGTTSVSSINYVLQTTHCTTQTQTITIVIDYGCNKTLVTEALEVPNVFTPNGDGVNDTWQFTLPKNWTLSGAEVNFRIYNRWGNIEYVTSSISNLKLITWDGHTTSGIECSAGMYFYVLEYKEANGDVKKKNGYISLMR